MIGSKGIITTGVYGFTPKLYLGGRKIEFDTSNQPGNEFGHQSNGLLHVRQVLTVT